MTITLSKITFALLTVFCINAAASFKEVGQSKHSCKAAKQDAILLAKTNCMGIDTEFSKPRVSKCKKDRQGNYSIRITYQCKVDSYNIKDDGYSLTVDENLDTYL